VSFEVVLLFSFTTSAVVGVPLFNLLSITLFILLFAGAFSISFFVGEGCCCCCCLVFPTLFVSRALFLVFGEGVFFVVFFLLFFFLLSLYSSESSSSLYSSPELLGDGSITSN
jgi:hypothetical protein